ncbi:MAG: TMEM165/GDT1 family protein [Candidatus Micrarchaeia archaeon]
MLEQFAVVFLTVALAEFGDKTQLAALALSAKYRKPLQIAAGSALAFLAATALAVAIGRIWGANLPAHIIKSVSGLAFIVFGVHSMLSREKGERANVHAGGSAFLASLFLIFTMEIGDKTNIANILLASLYNPIVVLAAALTAEVFLTLLAVYSARALFKKISRETTRRAAALLFILIGAAALIF